MTYQNATENTKTTRFAQEGRAISYRNCPLIGSFAHCFTKALNESCKVTLSHFSRAGMLRNEMTATMVRGLRFTKLTQFAKKI